MRLLNELGYDIPPHSVDSLAFIIIYIYVRIYYHACILLRLLSVEGLKHINELISYRHQQPISLNDPVSRECVQLC